MTVPPYAEGPGASPTRFSVDAGRLWMGGVATAAVAALVAVVGVLIARGLFDVAVLAPEGKGTWGDASTAMLAALAAAAALLATGLMHLLLLTTPRPWRFFTWIISLATLAVAIAPLVTGEDAATRIATAAIYLAVGIAIGSLVSSVARSAVRIRPERGMPRRLR
jgi:Family of unknown function (DUF6069)